MKGKIFIGTSGWSYRDANHIFYPENMKASEYLSYYAKSFDVTEINYSFYHMPKPTTVNGWMDKVPADFKFCCKMSKYLTHIKRLKESEEPLEKFFASFGQMKKMMGPVLIQLPPSLKFDESLATDLYKILTKKYKQYQFALEVRHETWLAENSVELMRKYKIILVISQSGVGFPYTEEITAKDVYVRFHGPGKLYRSEYDDETLQNYAGKFLNWADEGRKVWAFFNNDWLLALKNAETLKKMLG
ncbi:MAG: hypothetical protein JWO06_1357 [Bacteroidota bacterium]|nr:hypothetical protein [Bacteroidota bacterium]